MLWIYNLDPTLIREINHTSPSALMNKSLLVYNEKLDPIFTYVDQATDSLSVPTAILKIALTKKTYFFKIHDKDAVAIVRKNNNTNYIIITAAFDADRAEWLPKLQLILVLSFVISLTIVIISGYVFSLGLVRSISDLTNRINHISSKQFSQRLSTGKGKDELQQLAQTINNLLDRLQSSFNTQRGFIDNASHELSTPLASIASQLDVSLQKERTTEEYKEVMQSVNDDVKRLGFLVRSLLEIAKISGSAKGIELAAVRIDELLMRLPAQLKKIKSSYEVKLIFGELPDDDHALTIFGDEELLFSALKNIVHNACKFSPDKTAIVTLNINDEKIIITIKDHGPGINAKEFEKIFQPFYRSADATNIASGSGLGLPLANQIIKLYSGSIDLKSEIGKGTIFTITLNTTTF